METSSNPKTYQYTFYSSYNQDTNPTTKSFISPLSEQTQNSYRPGTFTTIHSPSYNSKEYFANPPSTYKEPVF